MAWSSRSTPWNCCAERLLYGKVGDEDVTVRVEEGKPFPKPGETARISAREDRLHWFNAETGKRV